MPFRYDGSGMHEVYDAARGLSDAARETFARAIVDHLGVMSGGRVLDLGCGTGRFSSLLRDLLGASVFALDVSKDMIGAAARRAELRGIRFVLGRAEALPLEAGSMDAVFAAMMYHHIDDKPTALRECARVLRADGRLLLYTPTTEALDSYLWIRFFPTALDVDRARLPSREELIESVGRAPFRLERHTTMRRPLTRDLGEYAERIGMRAISTLRLVSDHEFESGMVELRRYCAEQDRGETLYEDFDVFLFRASS